MSALADASRGALVLALRSSGVLDLAVLRALEAVPRENFLPDRLRDFAARDVAVPIGCGQTMLPPRVLAVMLEALAIEDHHRVLEIGTGSGFCTAVLAGLSRAVVSFERYRTLALEADARLKALGLVARIVFGDGLAGPHEFGRFDRIVVHASLVTIPPALDAALAENGRIVAGVPPSSDGPSALAVFERGGKAFTCRRLIPCHMSAPERGVARVL